MKRILTLVLSLVLCNAALRAQLLWRISGKDLARPGYVVGTYHLAKVSFVDSIPGLRNAMNSAEQVYGELNMTQEVADAETLTQKMLQAMSLPAGQTLDQVLTPEQYADLRNFLLPTLGDAFADTMLESVKRMNPGAVYVQLQAFTAMQMEGEGFDLSSQFDTYFQQVAQEQGKAAGGLESSDQQIQALYEGTTLERQVEQLMCFVHNPDYYKGLIKRTIEAFYAQDLAGIEAVSNEKLHNSCDATPEEEDALINKRNANWAAALPSIMKQKSTLVAVGVAHLPGEKGLLELLRKQGYTVEAVK